MAVYSSRNQMLTRWTIVGNVVGFTANGGRRNNRYVSFWDIASRAQKILPTPGQEFWIAMAVRPIRDAGNHIASWFDTSGAEQCRIACGNQGQLIARCGSTILATTQPDTFRNGVWHHLQWYVKIGGPGQGATAVRLDGVSTPIIDLQGVPTQNTSDPMAQWFGIGRTDVSEVIINDATGTDNNSWPGDVRIDTIQPAADGSITGWMPSAGARYECVRDVPTSTTNYIESAVPGDIATFQFSLPTGTIQAVQAVLYGMKTDAGARSVAALIRSGGQNFEGTPRNLPDSWVFESEIWERDPATGNLWLPAQQMEAGIKLVS